MGAVAVTNGPKIGSRNFTAFRAQAERCYIHAQLSDDLDTKERWVSLGEAWLALADRIELKWSTKRFWFLIADAARQNGTLH